MNTRDSDSDSDIDSDSDSDIDHDKNAVIVQAMHDYIRDSERF